MITSIPETTALIRKGKLDLAPLISHNLLLEEYNQGIELLDKQQATKVWTWSDQ